MKKTDWLVILIILVILVPFFIPALPFGRTFLDLTNNHPFMMAFVKFAILSTFGEMLALRIRKGVWNEKGFGVLPRMMVWGFLGMAIAMAMMIFKVGVPVFLDACFKAEPGTIGALLKGADLTLGKVGVAFAVSVTMNTIFAPVMMLFHKCTDIHIAENGGTVAGLLKPLKMKEIISKKVNWETQWGVVYKKTIPLFWFPAHTITFCLPGVFQVLFAAALGIALGLILALAGNSSKK